VEINKLEDLIPYREHLTVLWEHQDFQPALVFLSSLMKEQTEYLIAGETFKNSSDSLIQKAVWAANIRTLRMLISLPSIIKEAEKQIEDVKVQRERLKRSAEQGGI